MLKCQCQTHKSLQTLSGTPCLPGFIEFAAPVALQQATTGSTTGCITAVATPAAGEQYFYQGDPAYEALLALLVSTTTPVARHCHGGLQYLLITQAQGDLLVC